MVKNDVFFTFDWYGSYVFIIYRLNPKFEYGVRPYNNKSCVGGEHV